jgi:hypothetical protein
MNRSTRNAMTLTIPALPSRALGKLALAPAVVITWCNTYFPKSGPAQYQRLLPGRELP